MGIEAFGSVRFSKQGLLIQESKLVKILVLLYPYICCALFLLYIEHFELFSKNHFGLEFDKGRACLFIIPHRNTKEALFPNNSNATLYICYII